MTAGVETMMTVVVASNGPMVTDMTVVVGSPLALESVADGMVRDDGNFGMIMVVGCIN